MRTSERGIIFRHAGAALGLVAGVGLASLQSHAAAAPEATTATQERSRLVPPLVWGAQNQWKLQLGGDQRLRFERRDNFDLDKHKADNDDLAFVRTRLNMDLTYRSLVRVFLEVADSRQIGARTDVKQEAYWYLNQLFIEARLREGSPWSLTVGRQHIEFGDGRLVEKPKWSNLLKIFDGAKLRYNTSDLDVNLFLVQPDIYARHHKPAPTTDEPHPQRHTYFYGIYTTFKRWRPHEVDLFLLGLSDRQRVRTFPSVVKSESGIYGTSSRYTVGTRLRGPLVENECGKLGYGLEAAYQWGHVSVDEVRAYMLHADLNYQWNAPWKPKLTLEGNLASGDRRFGDGENNTFSPLFGSNHTPYGIMDFVQLQNLREVALLFAVQPSKKLTLQAEAHHYWLDSRTDTWYLGPGLRDKTGQSGRDLGDELSLVATYKLSKHVTLEGGIARFFPGNYPRKAGKTDNANLIYLQYAMNF